MDTSLSLPNAALCDQYDKQLDRELCTEDVRIGSCAWHVEKLSGSADLHFLSSSDVVGRGHLLFPATTVLVCASASDFFFDGFWVGDYGRTIRERHLVLASASEAVCVQHQDLSYCEAGAAFQH